MTKFPRRITALVCSLSLLACGGSKPPESGTTPPPPPSCSPKGCCYTGLPLATADQCGCEPFAAALEQRLGMSNINEQVRAKVARCVNGDLNATIYKWDIAKIKAEGCVKQEIELEPQVRDQLLKVLDEYKVSGEGTQDVWKDCYARTTSATPAAPSAAPSASVATPAPSASAHP
jgi:hypothetical protein